MEYNIIDLTKEQADEIESMFEEYAEKHGTDEVNEDIDIGILCDGKPIAGARSCIENKTCYIYTVFVQKDYRGKGLGRKGCNYQCLQLAGRG